MSYGYSGSRMGGGVGVYGNSTVYQEKVQSTYNNSATAASRESRYQVRDPYIPSGKKPIEQEGFQVTFTDSEMDDREDNIYRNNIPNNLANSNVKNNAQTYGLQDGKSRNQYDNIYAGQDAPHELYKNRSIDKGDVEDDFFEDTKHAKPFKEGTYTFEGSSNAVEYRSKDQVPEKGIQLIAFDPNSEKFFVNQEALSIIKLYDEPISLVALAGKYRTGKSFLLNKLMNLQGKGFKVEATTKSCTQGIWMWSKPEFTNGKQVFFIDTEGSTSIEGNKKHDAKIFSLALLISSLFIFNSVGAIDDRSIQELQLTTQISRNIQVSDNVLENDSLISQYTPKFIWLLRDFVLEVVDSRGQPITPNVYLHNCLTDQVKNIYSLQQKNFQMGERR